MLQDVVGFEPLVVALERVRNAITLTDVASFEALIAWVNDALALVGADKANSFHTHPISDIDGLQTIINNLQNANGTLSQTFYAHTHAIVDVTGLQTILDNKAGIAHAHTVANVSGLQTILDAKSSVGHNHDVINITGLQAALDTKANLSHMHTTADISGLDNTLANLAAQIAVGGGSGNGVSSVVGNMVVLTTSQTWTIPSGVTAAKVTLVGGGQGGSSYILPPNNWDTVYIGGSSGYVTTAYLSGLIPGTECIATIGSGGAANQQFGGYTSLTSNVDASIDFIAGGANGPQSARPGQLELGSNRGQSAIRNSGVLEPAARVNGASAPGFGNFKYGSGGMAYPFTTVPDSGESGVIIIEYMFAGSSNLSGGATGGGTDDIFYENSTTVNTSYTITSNKNAMSAGPITIADGVTVTVLNGSTWSVI
jgi:hypothetical protein